MLGYDDPIEMFTLLSFREKTFTYSDSIMNHIVRN